ncbi:MAG: tetratricopeptide repeat protein [Candidatus Eisenbacteria bacterium]
MKSRWNPRVVGALLLAAAVVVGCGSQFLAGGKLHYSQGRYDRALENFEKAIAEQPNNAEAHLWMGRTLAELERDEEAVVEIRRAGELDPLLLDPQHPEGVGNTLQSFWSHRYNDALKLAKDAADLAGEEQTEVLNQARDRFQRAIIYAPDSVSNYSNLGKVLYQLGEMEQAMAMFDKSRDLSAGRPDLKQFLFSLYKYFGERSLLDETPEGYERALSLLHDAESVPSTPADMVEVYFNIATAYYSLTEGASDEKSAELLANAATYYQKVLEINPADPDALTSLAYVYADQGKFEEAIAHGKQRYDLSPWDGETNLLMHRLYRTAGDEKMANGHILMVQILDQGQRHPGGDARAEAQGYGPSSDILKVLRDRGEPQEVRTFSVGDIAYSAWLFWSEGRIYIFRDGHELVRIGFKALTSEQLKEAMG